MWHHFFPFWPLSLVFLWHPFEMDVFIEQCVEFYRTKLINLLLEEPQTYDDLHILVEKLIKLREEFEEVIGYAENMYNCHAEDFD